MPQVFEKDNKMHLKYFLYEIAHHCNINCKSCDHCAPVAKEEFVDIDVFKKDIKRMSEIFSHILTIGIMGGEPLLNKNVTEILEYTREIFPKSDIVLFTNGLLLLDEPESFWKNLYKNHIIICVSIYNIKADYKKIKEISQKHNVPVSFKIDKNFIKTPYNLSGNEDNKEKIESCYQGNNCATLENGKLFRCPIVSASRHFNEFFNKDLKICDEDFIDIHNKSLNRNEILDYFSKPIPFCRYCNISKRENILWDISRRQIEEWT